MSKSRPFDISKCARTNILELEPYTCDRDNYPPGAHVTLLDANENAFGASILHGQGSPSKNGNFLESALNPQDLQLHRYPDAHSIGLKHRLCSYRNADKDSAHEPLTPDNICLGVGSDESIDGLIRAFCTPGKDKILISPPAYGMYKVSAQVNNVGIVRVDLDVARAFALRPDAICEALSNDPAIKIVFICSPGNPVGNVVARDDILKVLDHPTWNGVVVIDEAYIEFAPPGSTFATQVNEWPNLVVTQTMSKAFGLAAIRLGITYAQPQIIGLLNNLRGPYNMSSPTVSIATAALSHQGILLMRSNLDKIAEQRDRLQRELPKIPGFGGFLGKSITNFLLVQFLSRPTHEGGTPDSRIATSLMHRLRTKSSVLVRSRCNEVGCTGALRITVGTREEVDQLLTHVGTILGELYSEQDTVAPRV